MTFKVETVERVVEGVPQMRFTNETAEFFVPDGAVPAVALSRTTHMGIGAHQDDLEIMAYDGILRCFGSTEEWFLAVTVTNGGGSPRDGLYAHYTDEEMQRVRRSEQKKAAVVGEYSAVALLDYSSAAVKDAKESGAVKDLAQLIDRSRPRVVYTHNLTDKHDTHVAVALRAIAAVRSLPADARPDALYGCEVWRDLDWMADADKVTFPVGRHPNLASALLGIFDSQICGGKRYDLATIGRRTASATYHASHATDETTSLIFAMDLTPLAKDPNLSPIGHAQGLMDRFREDVTDRLRRLS